ncbi:MAG: hypothetical protein ACRC5W_03375 [Cetobacterium sp.]
MNKNNKTPIKDIENINERIIFEIMFNTGSVVDNRDNFGYIKDLLDKKWEKDLSISKKMIKNIEDEIKDSCLKTKVLKISILLTYIGNLTRLEKNSSVIKKKIEQLFDNEAKDTIFIIESSVDTDSNEFYNYVLELDDEYLKNIQMIEKVEVSINYKKETIVGNKYKDWILDQYFLNRFKEMRKLFFSQVDVKIYKYICFTGLIILIATKKNTESSSNNVIEMIDEIEKSDLIKKIGSVGDFFEHLKNIDATFIEGINSNLLDNEFKKYDKIKSLKTTKEVLNEETINVNKNIINLKNYLKNYIGSKIFLNFKEGNLNTLRIVSDSDIRKDKLNITFTTDDISKIVENWVPDNSNESDARDLILIELNKKRKKKEDKYSQY